MRYRGFVALVALVMLGAAPAPFQPVEHSAAPPFLDKLSPGEVAYAADIGTSFERSRSAKWQLAEHRRLSTALAALVPAIGAALHVYRSGRESGRNHLRMKALGLKLNLFRTELERPATLSQHLFTIHQCENTLLAEQQQWLQLMKECEWYG